MADEVTKVEATPIDDELSALSGAEKWLAETRERVTGELGQYNSYPVADNATHKQAKNERAHLNGVIKEVDAERRSMTKALTEAVKAFKADTDAVLGPMTDLVSRYDLEIKAYESRVVSERMGALREAYEDAAPDIAIPQEGQTSPLVPFELLVERYGSGSLGKKWTNYGTNDVDAEKQLFEALTKIAGDEEAIDGMVQPEDAAAVKAAYFSTLDMQSAVAEANRVKAQRERVARLEAERQARMMARDELPPQPKPQPVPQPVVQPTAQAPQPVTDDGSVWVFAGYGTKAQAEEFARWCALRGITRHIEADTHGRDYKLMAR